MSWFCGPRLGVGHQVSGKASSIILFPPFDVPYADAQVDSMFEEITGLRDLDRWSSIGRLIDNLYEKASRSGDGLDVLKIISSLGMSTGARATDNASKSNSDGETTTSKQLVVVDVDNYPTTECFMVLSHLDASAVSFLSSKLLQTVLTTGRKSKEEVEEYTRVCQTAQMVMLAPYDDNHVLMSASSSLSTRTFYCPPLLHTFSLMRRRHNHDTSTTALVGTARLLRSPFKVDLGGGDKDGSCRRFGVATESFLVTCVSVVVMRMASAAALLNNGLWAGRFLLGDCAGNNTNANTVGEICCPVNRGKGNCILLTVPVYRGY
ncbi:hypothetical protein EDD18DRAFT_1106308 [Armillaria luteobubalina]|uniref:Uncharacterized protein n=1 Tax=Armillaria luteobubalina TaxID=153913 RepID=A0AA39Q3X0_9AGAR|nr:hypothetical protein EDD18DRAFT_1106308 [Armillaria luteobubalina]